MDPAPFELLLFALDSSFQSERSVGWVHSGHTAWFAHSPPFSCVGDLPPWLLGSRVLNASSLHYQCPSGVRSWADCSGMHCSPRCWLPQVGCGGGPLSRDPLSRVHASHMGNVNVLPYLPECSRALRDRLGSPVNLWKGKKKLVEIND